MSQWTLQCLIFVIVGAQALLTAFDDTACDQTKGCFRNPSKCTSKAGDCVAFVSWQNAAGGIHFDLIGQGHGWVAVGFAQTNTMMGPASVTHCLVGADGNVTVMNTFNFDDPNPMINVPVAGDEQTGLTVLAAEYQNDTLHCVWIREIVVPDVNQSLIYPLNESYYLLLGVGPTNNGVVLQHEMVPVRSDNTIQVNVGFLTQATTTKTSKVSTGSTNAAGVLSVLIVLSRLILNYLLQSS